MIRQLDYRELFAAAFEMLDGPPVGAGWQKDAAQHIAGPLGRVINPGYHGAALIEVPDDPSWVLL